MFEVLAIVILAALIVAVYVGVTNARWRASGTTNPPPATGDNTEEP